MLALHADTKASTWDRAKNRKKIPNMGQIPECGLSNRLGPAVSDSLETSPKAFHFAFPSAVVTFGPVNSLGWRKISPWEAEIPKSPQSSVERRGASV